MKPTAPAIDDRTLKDLLAQMRSTIPFYTPEWNPTHDKDAGQALLKVYAHMLEQAISRLNQVPDKNFVAFLDMLGIKMLPAQSAVAYVTFSLADGTKQHVTVPQGTLLAGEGAEDGEEVIFETESDLRVSPAQLEEVFSIDVKEDRIFSHPSDFGANETFKLLSGNNRQDRSLYMGHADLLSQTNPSKIEISFDLAEGATGGVLDLSWAYWNGEQWVELVNFKPAVSGPDQNDRTELLSRSGEMTLEKRHVGEFMISDEISEEYGMKSRWLRCRLKNKSNTLGSVRLPAINSIRLSVNPIAPFAAELAFSNDVPVSVDPINVAENRTRLTVAVQRHDVELSFDRENIPNANDMEISLIVSKREPNDGDFVKLHNGKDAPEIRQITKHPNDANKFTLDGALSFGYEPSSIVEFVQKVEVEPIEKLDYSKKFAVLEREEDRGKEFAPIVGVETSDDLIDALFLGNRTDDEDLENGHRDYPSGASVTIVPSMRPFGELPRLFDTFYLATDEAFSKKGAKIVLELASKWANEGQINPQQFPDAVLSWEYWNGKSWQGLRVIDKTERFRYSKEIAFTCPDDIEKTEVNGEEKYWIRVRIIDGGYGKEFVIVPKNGTDVEFKAGNIHYPIINELKIKYEDTLRFPEQCFSLNNLDFRNHIKELTDKAKTFAPFQALPEAFQSVFLGFNRPLEGGPIRILFNLREQVLAKETLLAIQWFYWNGTQWNLLNATDGTNNLTKIGLLEFSVPSDFRARELFDKNLFWIKASVVQGQFVQEDSRDNGGKPDLPEIIGIYPNSTDAIQASVVTDEILGTSDLTENQEFQLLNPLVISQQLWVTEPTLPPEEEQKYILREEGKDAIEEVKNELGEIQAYRVRWHEVDDFLDASDEKSRHYTVDKRQGIIKFGDGIHGMVPPLGADNIRANYRYGGGKNGNVGVGKIASLKNAIPFIKEVINHLPADGGSETETLDEVLIRGPRRLKNRDRAVTSEDFEALASNASRKVALAKCLTNTDQAGEAALGHVTVMIVPDTQSADEPPSRLLRTTVRKYLQEHSANMVSAAEHIHVRGANYVEIVVEPTVVPSSLNAAARVEERVLNRLNQYIHPLTGGRQEQGWGFGEAICRSEIHALLEGIEDVDHVKALTIRVNGEQRLGDVAIDANTLPFSGEHRVNI